MAYNISLPLRNDSNTSMATRQVVILPAKTFNIRGEFQEGEEDHVDARDCALHHHYNFCGSTDEFCLAFCHV